ncbi:MAG: hypothetical protein RR585_13345 [Coprobacillus sp.]
MKLHYLYIDGRRYPINYSASVERNISSKFTKAELKNYKSLSLDKQYEYSILTVYSLIESGIGYINAFGCCDDKDIPKLDGKYKGLSLEELSFVLTPRNVEAMKPAIEACMKDSLNTEIKTRPTDKKKYQNHHKNKNK